MNCADVRDLLHPFLDGELEVDLNVSVLKHLELCPSCERRSQLAQQLTTLVTRAAPEPLDAAARARLLEGAYRRGARGAWRTWGPALAAAASLLAAGVLWQDPFCWRDCPTHRTLLQAHHVLAEPPRALAEVEGELLRSVAAPALLGPELLGANRLPDPSCSGQFVLRYRFPEGGQLCFFRLPRGHAHVGRWECLPDGREYCVVEESGLKFVGWKSPDGDLIGCMPCELVPRERLFAAAAALRDASP